MRKDGKGTLERAFELAKQGAALDEIRRQLKRESYLDAEAQLDSKSVRKQLLGLSRESRNGQGTKEVLSVKRRSELAREAAESAGQEVVRPEGDRPGAG